LDEGKSLYETLLDASPRKKERILRGDLWLQIM
jgi:hypothetical protein